MSEPVDTYVEETYTTATVTATFTVPSWVKHVGVRRVRNADTYELVIAVDGDDPTGAAEHMHQLRRILAQKLLQREDAA